MHALLLMSVEGGLSVMGVANVLTPAWKSNPRPSACKADTQTMKGSVTNVLMDKGGQSLRTSQTS